MFDYNCAIEWGDKFISENGEYDFIDNYNSAVRGLGAGELYQQYVDQLINARIAAENKIAKEKEEFQKEEQKAWDEYGKHINVEKIAPLYRH